MGKVMSEKMMVLGVDGLDPRMTRKLVDEGKLPNIKKYIENGAQRHDLVLLGGHPTVTPPMWTTLATGCYANVHGITEFFRHSHDELDGMGYNLDSSLCKAEQLWNVFAENGKKTLVWHWPGSSWPPSSESENLFVVDGTVPGPVATAVAAVDSEFLVGASTELSETKFIPKVESATPEPCVVDNVPTVQTEATTLSDPSELRSSIKIYIKETTDGASMLAPKISLIDMAQSPIKDAKGWADAPDDAKEMTLLLSGGLIRRPGLILKNENGIYDRVAIYRSKKEAAPMVTLLVGKMVYDILDEAYKNDVKYEAVRNMKLMDIEPDGSRLKLFVSTAMDIHNDSIYSPKEIYQSIVDNVGYFSGTSNIYTQEEDLNLLMMECWTHHADFQAAALHHLVDKFGVEVIFSHFHNVDILEHTFIRYLVDKGFNLYPEDRFVNWIEQVYIQADKYLGKFLHYLDEGWTIFIVSDHGLVCSNNLPPMIGDMTGLNVGLLEELGYTVLKRDAEGKRLRECDWSQTKAVATSNNIYINLKGRNPNGIVDPADKYELEEQIITDLYSYKSPQTGKRVIAVALRNKDAVLLGYGGEECGDICYWLAEGYNYDHTDSLSTTYGGKDTSVSPIFIAAGKGIKKGYETERIIREVDLVPTMAVLGGVRMPKQCEGAPVYQILDCDM